MNFCKKLCNECPFSKKSLPGWLASYSIEDFHAMMNAEVMFPCHMLMTEGDITVEEAQEAVQSGEMKVCRGYMESMIKSAKMPKFNKELIKYREAVKAEGLSEESMSMFEFAKHHTKLKVDSIEKPKAPGSRTQEEIDVQINGLLKEKSTLPKYSFFGTPNWEIFDIQIRILKGEVLFISLSENPELEDGETDEVYSAASDANDWLYKRRNENLFSD